MKALCHARTDDEFERQAGLLPVPLVGAEDGCRKLHGNATDLGADDRIQCRHAREKPAPAQSAGRAPRRPWTVRAPRPATCPSPRCWPAACPVLPRPRSAFASSSSRRRLSTSARNAGISWACPGPWPASEFGPAIERREHAERPFHHRHVLPADLLHVAEREQVPIEPMVFCIAERICSCCCASAPIACSR